MQNWTLHWNIKILAIYSMKKKSCLENERNCGLSLLISTIKHYDHFFKTVMNKFLFSYHKIQNHILLNKNWIWELLTAWFRTLFRASYNFNAEFTHQNICKHKFCCKKQLPSSNTLYKKYEYVIHLSSFCTSTH